MNNHYSPSADRNKTAILGALKPELSVGQLVLEIGSGTGQHACYFAGLIPGVIWQPTELESNITAINSWTTEHANDNIRDPMILDVDTSPWPITSADVCYTCNTLHIMSLDSVESLFRGCGDILSSTGKICVYGPFSIDDQHTSQSNAQFDQQLRQSHPAKGVRDLTKIDCIALQHGFKPCRYTTMPANNLFVVWER